MAKNYIASGMVCRYYCDEKSNHACIRCGEGERLDQYTFNAFGNPALCKAWKARYCGEDPCGCDIYQMLTRRYGNGNEN